MKVISTDSSGKVWMVGDSIAMPTDLNGIVLTTYILTAEQEAAFSKLADNRAGTIFDGAIFRAVPPDAPVVPTPTTLQDLEAYLKAKPSRLGALKALLPYEHSCLKKTTNQRLTSRLH